MVSNAVAEADWGRTRLQARCGRRERFDALVEVDEASNKEFDEVVAVGKFLLLESTFDLGFKCSLASIFHKASLLSPAPAIQKNLNFELSLIHSISKLTWANVLVVQPNHVEYPVRVGAVTNWNRHHVRQSINGHIVDMLGACSQQSSRRVYGDCVYAAMILDVYAFLMAF